MTEIFYCTSCKQPVGYVRPADESEVEGLELGCAPGCAERAEAEGIERVAVLEAVA